jgi:hypothetical protein
MAAHEDELAETLIHQRSYDVKVFRVRSGLIRLRGTLHDEKPAGLHFVGDPDPLPIHHMVVELLVTLPAMTITAVDVEFGTFPHAECPSIAGRYQALVGLDIARGFSRRVRELFGGPSGCTHVSALLQAMAPVVVQSGWSMHLLDEREGITDAVHEASTSTDPPRRWLGTLNTCHVWAAGGELVTALEAGAPMRPPAPFFVRAERLGITDEELQAQFDG